LESPTGGLKRYENNSIRKKNIAMKKATQKRLNINENLSEEVVGLYAGNIN